MTSFKSRTVTPAMTDRANAAIESALRTFEAEAGGVSALAAALRSDLGPAFAAATDLIRNAKGRLIVTGVGKSGHIGRKIAATLPRPARRPSSSIPRSQSWRSRHDRQRRRHHRHVVVRRAAELKGIVAYSRRFRIPLIAITAGDSSALAKPADVVLMLPRAREACPHGLAPTTSTLLQLAIGDALAIALLEARGFTPVDHFRMLHPGGKLGAVLTLVREVMHTRRRTPAGAARHEDAGRDGRAVAKALRLCRASSTPRAAWPASSPTATCAAMRPDLVEARVDDDHDAQSEDVEPQTAGERGARAPQRANIRR